MHAIKCAIGFSLIVWAGATAAYEDFQSFAASHPHTPWLRSTINGWGKTPLVAASSSKTDGIGYIAYIHVPDSEQQFKFDTSVSGDWSINYGDKDLSDACLDAEGFNIPFQNGAGLYEVRFNSGEKGQGCGRASYSAKKLNGFKAVYRSMYLRAALNNWGLLPMALVKDHVWEAEVSVPTNTGVGLKFDVNGDWTVNFGRPKDVDIAGYRNAGVASAQDGENLELRLEDSSGAKTLTATVRFDERSKAFALCPDISKPICR